MILIKDSAELLLGEIRCWSLLGLKGLRWENFKLYLTQIYWKNITLYFIGKQVISLGLKMYILILL